MNKIIKKLVSLIMALALVFSLCACSGGDESVAGGEGTDKFVKLVMYLIGEKPNDYEKALGKLNELIKEDLNAELEVRWMSWGDYSKKYPVLMSSGESFDLIYSVDWINYEGYAQMGAFKDITELLPKFAPKSYEALQKEMLDNVRVDGKLYALPSNSLEINPGGYVVRGDLMDKYGMESIDSFDDFMDYLKAVKENEDIMPINASPADTLFEFPWETVGIGQIAYDYTKEDSEALFFRYEQPEYLHVLERMREGYENGYWSKDVLMNKLSSKEAFLNGTSAAATSNLKNFSDLAAKAKTANPTYDPRWYPKNSNVENSLLVAGAYMSVGSTSKNPERAIMLLERLNTDARYYNLTTYGIEGEHYVINSDGKREFPAGVTMENTGFAPNLAGNWGWNSDILNIDSVETWEGEAIYRNKIAESGKWSAYLGFVFDRTKVENEIAAISSVATQYGQPLEWGMVDTEEGLETLKKQYKAAGIEKVMEEAKAQASEYLNSQE